MEEYNEISNDLNYRAQETQHMLKTRQSSPLPHVKNSGALAAAVAAVDLAVADRRLPETYATNLYPYLVHFLNIHPK